MVKIHQVLREKGFCPKVRVPQKVLEFHPQPRILAHTFPHPPGFRHYFPYRSIHVQTDPNPLQKIQIDRKHKGMEGGVGQLISQPQRRSQSVCEHLLSSDWTTCVLVGGFGDYLA